MSDKDSAVTRRRFLHATGGLAGAAALAGCTGGDQGTPTEADTPTEAPEETPTEAPETPTEEPEPTKTLELINATITTFDPVAATDTASGRVIQNVFDAMMNYPNGETVVENLLADDFTLSDDFKTYEFTLKDATYHNGKEVTAGDFVYAWKRLAFSENSRRTYFILDSLGVPTPAEGELDVEAVDDKTLRVNLKEPFHSALEMMAYTSFSPIPEGIVGDIPGYDGEMEYNEFATSNPVGSGPFVFDNWTQGTEASITRYGDYHGQKAKIAGVHWQVIEDDSAAYNYAMNRNADVFGIPTAQYDPDKVSIDRTDDQGRQIGTYGPLRNGDTANYVKTPLLLFFYVGFNMANVEKPVRQAFAYAMDQELMVREVFKSRGQPAYHSTPPSIFPGGAKNYDKHVQEKYPYGVGEAQLDKAKAVMEDAGYGPNNRVEVQWTQYTSTSWKEMATILRDQLSSAYIDMNIQEAPFSTLLQRGRNGELSAYTLGWIADWPAPDNFLQLLNPPQTDTSQKGPISYTNWKPEYGDAYQKAVDGWELVSNNPAPTEAAEEKRNEGYIMIEEANWEDVAFLNVYHRVGERFWYDWADITPYGGMGGSRQKYNNVTIGERG